jgi:hypothetical protein
VNQGAKHEAIYNHFLNHMGSYVPRQCTLNLADLGWEPRQLSHMDLPFSEDEILAVIKATPKEKAPGLDVFIGLFFSSCWDVVNEDIMRVIQYFHLMNQQDFRFLNQAYVVLIPKKQDPQRVVDYKSISLTHSFAKIISKILVNRLGPELKFLISINQATFIKKRCIHNNFVFVQQVVEELHKKKIPYLFIKWDISKAFDSVSWPYLLDIMTQLGFGQKWIN